MKEKIIIFLSGLILGAIIATGSIYVYTVANNSNGNDVNMQMPNDRIQNNDLENGGTPPDVNGNENNNQGN